MVLFMKCMPWFLIKTLQHPSLVITCSNKKCAMVSALQSFTGMDSAHIVMYSITVMMYISPILLANGLISPTKSIAHLSNACNFTCGRSIISSLLLGLPTLC
jgi:hypothetical protein